MDNETDNELEDDIPEWRKIKLSRKAAEWVFYYISHDFLSLIFFMIIYRRYPYHLAYMRIYDTVDFLKIITCRNKEKFIVDELFQGIKDEECAKERIERYCDFLNEKFSNEADRRFFKYYKKQVYIYPKRKKGFIFKDAPKNLIIFRKLIEKAVLGNLYNDTDIWHFACEQLFFRKNYFALTGGWVFSDYFKKIAYETDEKKAK